MSSQGDCRQAILKAKAIRATYYPGRRLNIEEFEVLPSDSVLLVGSSGSGKSALLKMFVGLLQIQDGTLFRDGFAFAPSPRSSRENGVHYLRDEGGVFLNLTIEENIAIAGSSVLGNGTGTMFDATMRRFPWIRARRKERASALSGGEQRLLAITMCLVGRPRVILADEPSRGLSPASSSNVFQLFSEFRAQGTAIVFSDDRPRSVLAHANRFCVLRSGIVERHGKIEELTDNLLHQIYS